MDHKDGSFDIVQVSRGGSDIVLVCEHASSFIPAELDNLGISDAARQSHVAWDPGAMAVATHMKAALDATLVSAKVSRLVYDCNRPPSAPDAMPVRSEAFDVPGNHGLSETDKQERVARYYAPFHDSLATQIARQNAPVIVTVHSFTPVYLGSRRAVEIGILHDSDARLADAILGIADGYDIRRNLPYGPDDGVTHTLKEHAIKHGHLNVMIEVRNDLISDIEAQRAMAVTLTDWVTQAIETVEVASCKV